MLPLQNATFWGPGVGGETGWRRAGTQSLWSRAAPHYSTGFDRGGDEDLCPQGDGWGGVGEVSGGGQPWWSLLVLRPESCRLECLPQTERGGSVLRFEGATKSKASHLWAMWPQTPVLPAHFCGQDKGAPLEK